MKTPPPSPEDPGALSAALRRDAARIQEQPFDPALHHATLRRIRALEDEGAARWSGSWRTALAGVAALAVLALCIGLWQPRRTPDLARLATPLPQTDFAAMLASTRTAVAGLSSDLPPVLPEWMSPTASLLDLDLPRLRTINPNHQL